MPGLSRRVTIANALGLHLRAADQFVGLAQQFRADVQVHLDGKGANGKSILDLTTLAAACGVGPTGSKRARRSGGPLRPLRTHRIPIS